jgi:CheY-like chemotaxis protein
MLLMRKDEFLASISHELRTSLSTLLLTIENLRLQRRESSTELPQKAVRNIEKSSEQLLEIVNELVDLASLSSGRQVLHSERVDLVELCRSTIATLQTLAARNGIRLKVKIAGVPEQIEVDPTRLKQCLVNLLNISIRSTGDGGTVCLQVEGDQAAREISFTVWNMDMGVQALSEFSSQGNKITGKISNHFPASANELGLAVAAGLVELLGGRISVEHSKESSSLNRYQITLSFRQAIWERVAVFSSESPEMGLGFMSSGEIPQTQREPLILIVDDNEANLLALRDALENELYRLELARSGEEAVSRTLEIHPNLVLMDIHMPGIGGLEAIRQIRSLNAIHDVPIIALTAFAMMEDRQKCLEAGANDYLAKPFRLKELYAMILAWLKSEPGVIV